MTSTLTGPPPGSRARTTDVERWSIWALAAAAGLGAALSPARPTGLLAADVAWCAALGVVVVLAASRARRWPTLWMAGVATTAGVGSWWALAGLAALALATVGAIRHRRDRVLAAAVGALAIQSLLRLPDLGFHGLPTLLGIAAVAPVLWSGYQMARRPTRRLVRRAVAVGALASVLALVGVGLAVALAQGPLRDGVDAARRGLDLVGRGDQPEATREFDEAATSFDRAHADMVAPWAWPARALPVVGQHVEALATASAAGQDVANQAALVADTAPYQDLRVSGGQLDLAAAAAMAGPVERSVEALRQADADLDGLGSGWLLPPLASRLDELTTSLGDALPTAELAADALRVAPGLLGGDGPRTYLVLFTSPAETRFLGGFVGSYGILTAEDGRVALTEAGSITELARRGPSGERSIAAHPEFEARYARYAPQRHFQNLTVSPDLPTDATVAADLYRQTTGQAIDGVIVADPAGVRALLQLTGPVDVGLDEPLDAGNALDYLLTEQYLRFAGSNEERRDLLEVAAEATFEALTSRDLPSPAKVGDALHQAVEGKHLLFWAFDPQVQPLLDRVGLAGRFAPPATGDHLSLRTANANGNKADVFLHRSLDYQARFLPETGRIEATATITLRNEAPAGGLPDYVIGNIRGEPPGTNSMYLSLYSPLDLVGATQDGATVPMEPQHELGSNVYSRVVSIPPGGTVTLTLELAGDRDPSYDYRLALASQPVVHPDQVTVAVSGLDGWTPQPAPGVTVEGGVATAQLTLDRDRELVVPFRG